MNETTRIEEESDARQHDLSTLATGEQQWVAPCGRRQTLASVRVSPGGYFIAACVSTFVALVLFQAGKDFASFILLCSTWFILPILAFTDRIKFDGRILFRSGIVAFFYKRLKNQSLALKIEDIERIETNAVRTLRRGGRVRYRHRSEVSGGSVRFVFASGGKEYKRMARNLFPLICEDKLDARTMELRDYLGDQKSLDAALCVLHIAPASMLDVVEDFALVGKNHEHMRRRTPARNPPSSDDLERGRLLHRAGNELRVAGRLREAAEAFRRALLVEPHDARLIYDWARLLRSLASARRDARLLARSRAGLWLAARYSLNDHALLARIGESLLEAGDTRRAALLFRRAMQDGAHVYRAELGLADIALRTGKLAHVVHHYGGAARVARDQAAERFALRESAYYARLNTDDYYLALELRRINWLQHLRKARRIATRLIFTGVGLAISGAFIIEESIRVVGWSLASSALLAWLCAVIAEQFFTHRREAHHTD